VPGGTLVSDQAFQPAGASRPPHRPPPRCVHPALGNRLPAPTCRRSTCRCWSSKVTPT